MPRMTLFAASLAMAVGLMDPGGDAVNSVGLATSEPAKAAEHRSPGKPGAPVSLEGPSRRVVPLSEATEIPVTLQAGTNEGLLTVEIKVGDGLTLVSPQARWQLALDDSQELTLPLEIVADAPGDYFVHVFTEIEQPSGVNTSRALAVQITAGETAARHYYKGVASTEVAPDLIRLPARETIR